MYTVTGSMLRETGSAGSRHTIACDKQFWGLGECLLYETDEINLNIYCLTLVLLNSHSVTPLNSTLVNFYPFHPGHITDGEAQDRTIIR
jgi:hypothetical protein